MSAGISIMDLAKRKQVTAKLGSMRKAQTFSVYPKARDGIPPGNAMLGDTSGDDRFIFVQSERAIGAFDPVTGRGTLYIGKGPAYFVHLAMGKPYTFPPEFVAEAREIWDPQTSASGVRAQVATVAREAGNLEAAGSIPAGSETGADDLTPKPYRNGLHGVRVSGSAGVPRDGRHFARWNKR